ncbi:male-specific histamine-binding salivary protein-like [Haemaphysalis longicornis]
MTRHCSITIAIAMLVGGGVLVSTDLPERKPYLSPFQDAWKTFRQNSTFVIYQRTFEHDPVYDLTGRCVHGAVIGWDEERKVANTIMRFWSKNNQKFANRSVPMTLHTTDGYTVPNGLFANLDDDMIFSIEYTFVVSEYENCDLLRVPHRSNGCEMWVLIDRMHEVSSLCHFIYDLLCGMKKYRKYEEEFCNEKMRISQ